MQAFVVGVGGIFGIIIIALGIKIRWFRHSFTLNQDICPGTNDRYRALNISDTDAIYGSFRLNSEFRRSEENVNAPTDPNAKRESVHSVSTLQMTSEMESTTNESSKSNNLEGGSLDKSRRN